MTTWTKPKPMLKHERELWRDAVLDAADGDEDIARIAKHLQTAVDLQRGRSSGLGEQGVWMIENEVRDDRS